MDKQVSKWIIEFLIRQRVDDSVLDHLISKLPLEDVDYRLEKGLLLRRIQTEVSMGVVSEKILDLLELVGELDFCEGKFPLEATRTAYSAVALDCTVRFLEMEDYRMYSETLQKIWRGRVQKMANSGNSGLISEKLWSLRDDLEVASSNVEIRDKIVCRNTRFEALKAVKACLAESWNELGPSFLEKIAEDVYRMGNAGQGINALGDKQGFEGLGNLAEAGNEDNVPEKDQDLENVVEAQNGMTFKNRPTAETQGLEGLENVNEAGKVDNALEKEQGLDGLQNVIEAHDEIIPTPCDRSFAETQHKQGSSRRKHIGIRRKILYGSGSKAKISNTEEVEADEDISKSKYRSIHTPEVNQTRADLESSIANLNAAVRDPLSEALRIAERVSSDVQRDTDAGGNHVTEKHVCSTPTDKRDHLGGNGVENIRGDAHPEQEEHGNENTAVTSDPLEFTEESSPSRPRLQSPKRRRISPLKTYPNTKIERRRKPKKWSVLEEDTLRKGVQQFGRGNWKAILMEHRNIFEERTEVDLKDKWRNLTWYRR